MRVAGVTIPSDKRLVISVQYVYGIGPRRAAEVCKKAKLDENIRVKDLDADQEEQVRAAVADYLVESDLKREVTQNIKRLQEVGSYRGFRHRKRLPVRGQKTKTNARTKRGKKTTIANKKKVAK